MLGNPVKPQGSTWTDDQWQAITLKGSNMLVAAAAGSGKTAVLVERIIRRIADEREPIDVDRLLVATFTKASAAEMKHRIRDALEAALLEQPRSQHLRRQLALIGRASITTLHSFCLEVIQRYYALIGLDPGFRMANETESELMRQDLLAALLEERYAESQEADAFWKLAEFYGGERGDAGLHELVMKLYDQSRSHPWPDQWMREMTAMYGQEAEVDLRIWQESLLLSVRMDLQGAAELLCQGIALTELPGGPSPYGDNLREDSHRLDILLAATEAPWDVLGEAFQAMGFNKLKPCRGDSFDKELQEEVKALRKTVKDTLEGIRKELFMRTPEDFAAEMQQLSPILLALTNLVHDFGVSYQKEKSAKRLLDFSDLEHYCLQILRDPNSAPGNLIPSQAAQEYRKQFVEVLLDEYQDTNQVQEAIVFLISNEHPGNRFMVGDVKQSIYRFRLAEPGLFLQKYKSYANADEVMDIEPSAATAGQYGIRIDLARNFRSRREVVDSANFIFKQVMNESVGEISYDNRAALAYGANYPDLDGADYSAELLLIDRTAESDDDEPDSQMDDDGDQEGSDSTEGEEAVFPFDSAVEETQELETAQLEARAIAVRIKELIGTSNSGDQPFVVYDKKTGGSRPASYRDIVILLRATGQWSPILIEELRLQGIPAYAELNTGYFKATEVEIMMSLLKVIDNPYQDVPLAAVLRSPIVSLSAEHLARVRLAAKKAPFYEAVQAFAASESEKDSLQETREQIRLFLQQHERWRQEARNGSLADLIWNLYRETGLYDFVGAMPGGVQRQANLRALYDRARQYETTSFRGLFRFLRFIERMQDSGADLGTARALGEQEDVVRIMSIHKSKGLEFPIVFVAGIGKMFNQRDMREHFLIHKELGFGPKFVDTSLRISYPTLPALAIRRRMKLETLAEEMRILYVALTRAKEKLILIGTAKKLESSLQNWARLLTNSDSVLPDYMLAKAKSYLDWIGPALIRHPDALLWRQAAGKDDAAPAKYAEDPSKWKLDIVSASRYAVIADKEPAERAAADEAEAEQAEYAEALKQSVLALAPIRGVSGFWQEEIASRLSWTYSYPLASTFLTKTTVTELKRLSQKLDVLGEDSLPVSEAAAAEEDIEKTERGRAMVFRRPRFMEARRMTAAERGTVYHAVMQLLPLHAHPTKETVESVLQNMLARELLSAAQSEVIDADVILPFFDTEVGKRLLKAHNVQREVPFSFGLSAAELYPHADEITAAETVLVQGVIDCLFEDDNGLVLLDYKTDTVRGASTDELRARYELQIRLYTRAIEHILRKPISRSYLYYLDGSILIDMGY